ncbi:UDP-Gal or UDP-GlcNAc-dependent glycosyltransferase, partial [Trypanosoma grayi]|uniref:UDP-Gal or UDP-GlcNAc-dependent glycosyltransferase n=1 Tax=Trypanosoma grayi TaxID=71804 RepID=UPI0004F490BA
MRRRSHSTSNAIWKYILFVCVVFAVLYRTYIGVRTHSIRIDYNGLPNVVSSADSGTDDFTEEDTLLRDIPNITTQQWQTYDFLIVLGIPSIDIDARQRRRYLQRSTCWRFPGVATRANNFTGAMLVLYVLARHPSHNFTYSTGLEAEAEQWHDVIALPMNDGRPSTSKKVGGDGKWGLEAEIGLSRKTFFWFELALRLFPNASYIAKGDDDMFLRVPQYLADLRTLPRKGLYWGPVGYYSVGSARAKLSFRFIVGFCMTLARDVVWKFVSYRPLQRLARLPYTSQRLLEYQALNMNSE